MFLIGVIMDKMISLLRYLRQLSFEKDKTISNLDELDFYMYLDDLPKNSTYIASGGAEDEFILRIKRPFSSKSAEDRRIQDLYHRFLKLFYIIQNENEDLDLYIANAVLTSSSESDINYPVFTKRINISMDPKKQIIELKNSNVASDLNVKLLSKISNVNPMELKRISDELRQNYYNPISSKESAAFMRGIAKRLHAEGQVVEDYTADYKLTPVTLIDRNVIILAPKTSAATTTFDRAIAFYEADRKSPIIGQISGDSVIQEEEVKPLEFGLFTKEYNSEQLNILKSSYAHTVTLVDGPPGSGKTHTVANIIGHYLAEGKRILVLSKKKKALRVIKNMIDPAFNGLVVSRIMDSNDDINETLYYINEFISNHTTLEMEAKAKKLAAERSDILSRMEETKSTILNILETEGLPIYYDDEKLTPIEAAKFVVDNYEYMSLIPGSIKNTKFPFDKDELDYLYNSNKEVTFEEEKALDKNLPDIEELLTPSQFEEVLANLDRLEFESLKYKPLAPAGTELVADGVKVMGETLTSYGDYEELYKDLEALRAYIDLPEWQQNAIRAGLNIIDNKQYKELSRLSMEVDRFRAANIETLTGKKIDYPKIARHDIIEELGTLEEIYSKKDKPGTFDMLFKKNRKLVMEEFKINNEPIRSKKDVSDAIVLMNYDVLIDDLKSVYDELIANKEGESFEDYFKNKDFIFQKLEELHSFKDLYMRVHHRLTEILPAKIINKLGPVNENPSSEILAYLSTDIYNLLKLMNLYNKEVLTQRKKLETNADLLSSTDEIDLVNALKNDTVNKKLIQYGEDYSEYEAMSRRLAIAKKRQQLLKRLDIAPSWREFLDRRFGIHGEREVPDHIETAWKVKILDEEVSKIIKNPYEKMRKMLSWYRKSIIENNREYARTLSWYHFLKRMDDNPEIRQTLKGLELTYKKIGKGTGRDAKELKAKADDLLREAQGYVPCWLMTIDDCIDNVALKQYFDLTIVDEASQADILSLPIVYTSPKIIAIGDDKQTTPLYANIGLDRVKNLRAASLSEDFPNYHLMDLTTSLYDILKASFPSFLLKEQFRSVPEIIEYSNKLSYDGKILPLRDTNDTKLKPALNLVHVDGVRDGDINKAEADKILQMIKDLLADPAYDGKTIGVISLLGEAQAKFIDDMMIEQIDIIDYDNRKLMAGTPVDFQGDERDIIFLSMVDSPQDKPLRLMSEGGEDLNKKRYNVAFSRARDQEFLVTSLKQKDLKTGDIRQFTIEYFEESHENYHKNHRLTAFEEEIKSELERAGFEVETNHSAGKYPLPLVVKEPKVAVMAHSASMKPDRDKLNAELETTLTLERVGWKLAHIRESKYIYDPKTAIDELVENINNRR